MGEKFRVSIDIGGTFTDLVYFKLSPSGKKSIHIAKTDTTPPNFEQGIFDLISKENIDLSHVDYFGHGSTIIINALTEKKGAKTGLITTKGFRDVLEIARGNRPDFFNLDYEKPPPIIPRYLRKEVTGRMNYQGKELAPLDLSSLPGIIKEFKEEQVESIAVCLINSYVNPSHEIRVVEEIRRLAPEMQCMGSYQISREWREYERMSTVAFCAYVRPIAQKYLSNLDKKLAEKNYKNALFLMQSNCGVDTLCNSKETPITMVESGPASGMWAVQELGKLIGEKNLIGLDIGGTTAKCSLLKNGHIKINSDYFIDRNEKCAGYPLMIPVVDILEIGNGGGSIAWVDGMGKLNVGPKSAGASPGPIAYNKGGKEPTTTDANLILNRINKEFFCGGKMVPNLENVDQIFEDFGKKMQMNKQDLARSIIAIANHNMSNAIKLISVNRGYDPRDFTLVAFGGGGAMHAAYLLKDLGIKKFIIPKFSGVFSSWGMLMSDLRRDFFQSFVISLESDKSSTQLNQKLNEIELYSTNVFKKDGLDCSSIKFKRYANIRYENQGHSVEIELPDGEIDAKGIKLIQERFYEDYKREFTYSLPNNPVEIVCLHVITTLIIPNKLTIQTLNAADFKENPSKGKRLVDFSEYGVEEAEIFDGDKIGPGFEVKGPVIIEDTTTTIVVPPHFKCKTDDYGNYHICAPEQKDEIIKQTLNQKITFEIIEHSLQAVSSEMFSAIKRTAMSTIIYEIVDMGTALTDAYGNLASSGAGIPAFVGALDKAIKKIVEIYKDDIYPGDLFILNDPYSGGITHLNDLILANPIFYGEKRVAWSANIAHWNDVSGKNQGSMSLDATEIFQEGIIIPPVKLFDKRVKNSAVFLILSKNTRMPDFMEGDLWAQIAATRLGENRILELIEKYSMQTFLEAIDFSFQTGESMTKQALSHLPQGTFSFSEMQEKDLLFTVSITISPSEFLIDLTKMPDQLPVPFNISKEAAMIPAQLIFKSFTSPDSLICNAGTLSPLKVLTRPGSMCDPKHPAPQSFYYETKIRLYDFLWRACSEKLGLDLPAGHFASICGTIIGGVHPDTGKSYSVIEAELGGWGASAHKDGNSCIFSGLHGETFNCPAEVSESRNGLLVECMKLNEEKGGEGEKRGGKGVCLRYVIRGETALVIAGYTRSKIVPWGIKGGNQGSGNYLRIIKDGGKSTTVCSEIMDFGLKKGDVIEINTGNGGGWGDPRKRERNLVEMDLKNGFISKEEAKKIHGYF